MSTITHVIEQADGQLFVAFEDGGCEALRRDDPEDALQVAAADAAVDAGALRIERVAPDPRLAAPPRELRLEFMGSKDPTKAPLGGLFGSGGAPLAGTRRTALVGGHRCLDWEGAKKRGRR